MLRISAEEIASMTATVISSFDVTITVQRDNKILDPYGHTKPSGTSATWTVDCNVYQPSATTLQSFASVIGSQQALMVRFAETSDMKEGDIVLHDGKNWEVHNVQRSESYTFAFDALIATVT